MTDRRLSPAYRRAIARWRRTALAIAADPAAYTTSQRALAWAFLRQHGARP